MRPRDLNRHSPPSSPRFATLLLMLFVPAALVLGSASLAEAQVLFGNPVHYGLGNRPTSVAAADLNGDGSPDLVLTNYEDNTVSVLRNNGDGTFMPRASYATGVGPWAVAIADYNLDTYRDLAVVNSVAGTVSILLGSAAGTFGPKTDFATGGGASGNPWSIEAGETNSDGKIDLAIVNSNAGQLAILRGNGAGGFTLSATLPAGTAPTGMAMGDVNADGFNDVLVAGYQSHAIYLYRGTASGTFQPAVPFGGGILPLTLKIGNLDGNASPDLAVAGFGSGDLLTYSGDGAGNFAFTGAYQAENAPYSVTIGDLNNDGWSDVAVANYFVGLLSVHMNDMQGHFGAAIYYPAGYGAQMVVSADLNGDGRLDLATAISQGNTVAVHLNTGPTSADRAPVVSAPPGVVGNENALLSFGVTASDPDGDAITSLTAAGNAITAGGSFVANPSKTSGTFNWTPTYQQAGTYTVTISASNACRPTGISGATQCMTGIATTAIVVSNVDRAPVVSAPASVSGTIGSPISFTASAFDPDGGVLSAFTASPLPAGASFSTAGTGTTGAFNWTPGAGQAGTYAVVFTATNALVGSATTQFTITGGNGIPVISGPAGIATSEGSPVGFQVTATDPEGGRVTLTASNRPVGSTFVDNGNSTGNFTWTPSYSQAGAYSLMISGRDPLGAESAVLQVAITVDNVNRAPTAVPGGPYAGIVGVALTFNGTGSADPDGDALGYGWSLGDAMSGVGSTPAHAYMSGGTFVVTLTVSDGAESAVASTIASIQDVFPAHAFTTGGNGTIRLGSGKAIWCAQIEPVGGSYLNTAVVPSSISMTFGAGRIFAQSDKVSIGGDKDANGVPELSACFSKADLRTLFTELPKGTNTVTVVVEGELTTGGRFRGNLTVDVVSTGGSLVAMLSPNPLNPTGALTFTTTRAGWARVSIFDLNGRLVRRVVDLGTVEAGYHDVRVDGLRGDGSRLPSGVYFYRVEASEGSAVGRVVIAK